MNAKIGGKECRRDKGYDLRIIQNGHLLKQLALQIHLVIVNSLSLACIRLVYKANLLWKQQHYKRISSWLLIIEGSESMVSSFLLDEFNRFSITSDHSMIVVTLNEEFTALPTNEKRFFSLITTVVIFRNHSRKRLESFKFWCLDDRLTR